MPAMTIEKREWLTVAILLGLAALPRLATLHRIQLPSGVIAYQHFEGDEGVFPTLAAQVRRDPLHYSLRGTPYLAALDAHNDDKPIFFHPPLFVYTLALFSFAHVPLPLVPVLFDLATIALVFWIARRLYDRDSALWAALLAAAGPVGWFLSQKIWIDGALVMTTSASFAALLAAADRKTVRAYLFAGLVFALALLSKSTGLLVLPAVGAVAPIGYGMMNAAHCAVLDAPSCNDFDFSIAGSLGSLLGEVGH